MRWSGDFFPMVSSPFGSRIGASRCPTLEGVGRRRRPWVRPESTPSLHRPCRSANVQMPSSKSAQRICCIHAKAAEPQQDREPGRRRYAIVRPTFYISHSEDDFEIAAVAAVVVAERRRTADRRCWRIRRGRPMRTRASEMGLLRIEDKDAVRRAYRFALRALFCALRGDRAPGKEQE